MKKICIGTATLILGDCNEFMEYLPDKSYDLAVVDPPYGIGISNNPIRQKYTKKQWDDCAPNKEYFYNLMRSSVNQIIWGGNYFIDFLGNTQGFLIWDKVQPHDFSLAMCEFAWSSIQKPAKMFKRSVLLDKNKIHPTQKPVKLYEWIYSNYAKQGNKIIDTHGGSMSSVIAALNMGFEITCIEKDEEYFYAAVERIENAQKQMELF